MTFPPTTVTVCDSFHFVQRPLPQERLCSGSALPAVLPRIPPWTPTPPVWDQPGGRLYIIKLFSDDACLGAV